MTRSRSAFTVREVTHASATERGDAPPQTSWWAAAADRLGAAGPHTTRGPLTRWPRTIDAALVVVVFAGSLVAVTASAVEEGEDYRLSAALDLPAPAAAILVLAAAALWWRRSDPVVVAAAVMALLAVWAVAEYGDGQELALIAALYAVGRYSSDHRHSAVVLVTAIVVGLLGTIVDPNQRVDVLPAVVLAGLPWYVGRRVRNRGAYVDLLMERAERLEAEQQARARQAVADERSRIARELHDVVAHQVSMMTVQAGAAKTIARADPDAAIEAMGDVERAGRQALGELRHLLGVLRTDHAGPGDLGPQPRLADIPALAEDFTHTGADIRLALADLPHDIPAAVDVSGYRIVQESLTNVLKHAGNDPRVEITTSLDDGWLTLEIENTTRTPAPDLPRSGYGIAGMQERAAILGGTLTASPDSPGRFRVVARLPLRRERS